MPFWMLKLFKVGWILIGWLSVLLFISWKKNVITVIAVVWIILRIRINIKTFVIVIVLGVNQKVVALLRKHLTHFSHLMMFYVVY